MSAPKMHADEVDTDVVVVRRLLTAQFPQWADLPIIPVRSAGTDNAIYRLGDDLVVRLPRIHWAVGQVAKEHHWLPRLAPFLPLALPLPLAQGIPGEGYPYPWAVYQWLSGEHATIDRIADPSQAALELAQFITALQHIDTTGGSRAAEHNLRGDRLAMRDAATRQAIAVLQGMIDTDAATAVWEAALEAPAWNHAPVWFHGDLLGGNILVDQGRLSAVIDWSGLGVGDPACDLMIAWDVFEDESRNMFRVALGMDNATWARGRGHALSQALIFIPYYLDTNPVGVANARRRLDAVLADYEHNV